MLMAAFCSLFNKRVEFELESLPLLVCLFGIGTKIENSFIFAAEVFRGFDLWRRFVKFNWNKCVASRINVLITIHIISHLICHFDEMWEIMCTFFSYNF